jgi:hypothetical protein
MLADNSPWHNPGVNPAPLASMLQSYGPWGVCALLFVAGSTAAGILWRELLLERKRRDADAQGFALAQIQNVRDAFDREARFSDIIKMFAGR